jgi:7-cyano-7-deazaguanine synthase
MRHNVVLFSGGMDSTTLLAAIIRSQGIERTTALSILYGSRHNAAEMAAAQKITEYFDLEHVVLTLPEEIFKYSGSTLMGEGEIPEGEYIKDGPQSTVVPFRNGTMISVAVAVAHRYEGGTVWIATHKDDGEGWAYPDCRPEFLIPLDEAITAATIGEVSLAFPYVDKTKAEIVQRAAEVKAPLAMSYSCYKGGDRHCGTCATCSDRQDAFHNAGYKDPTEYTIQYTYAHEALETYPTLDKE